MNEYLVYLYIQEYKYTDQTTTKQKNNTCIFFVYFNNFPIAYIFLQHMGV
jgi:hypothetical protein